MASRSMEELYDRGKDLIQFYRQNPCIAAYDLLGVDFAPIQRLVFNDMWFKNFVITVASRGLGKCCSVDSLSYIENEGLLYLYEVLPPIPNHLSPGAEEVRDFEISLFTDNGFYKSKKLALEKELKGLKIRTSKGFELSGSEHHPLLTIGNDGVFVYKSLDEFKQGDVVCISKGNNVFGPNIVLDDDAYLLGLLLGLNANTTTKKEVEFAFNEEYFNSWCSRFCVTYDIDCKVRYTPRHAIFKFIDFAWFFDKYKLSTSVPISIRTGDKDSQIYFLRGLFDTKCNIQRQPAKITIDLGNRKLAKEVQLMLLNLDIVAGLVNAATLVLTGQDSVSFINTIGFNAYYNKLSSDDLLLYYQPADKRIIPHVKNVCKNLNTYGKSYSVKTNPSYSSLKKFVDKFKGGTDLGSKVKYLNVLKNVLKKNYYYDIVTSINSWSGDCYDFEMNMPSNIEPNYFANGFICHNTFMLGTLAALSAILYPGNKIGLIGPVYRQCIVITDTYVTSWMSNGLNTGNELYKNIIPGQTKIQSINSSNTVNHKWQNKSRRCITLNCSRGFNISGTVDHRVQVLDSRLNINFKKLNDIHKGEYAVIKTNFNYFGNNDSMPKFDEFEHDWRTKDCLIPKELTPDLAYWMGLLVGDGCVSVSESKRKQRVDFVSEDQDLLDSFERYLRDYFLINKSENIYKVNRRNNTWEIQYFCKKLVQYLLKCGFTKTTALDKKVPDVIKKASREVMIAFLQGLFDTDGGVYVQTHKHGYTHCEVTFNTSSSQLSREVHSILLNLGIVSSLCINNKSCVKQLSQGNKPSKCSESYKIRITNKIFIERFNNTIGFRSLRKSSVIDTYIDSHLFRSPPLSQGIGLANSIAKEWSTKCDKYFDDGYYFVKVISKDEFKSETIDIEVENEHCYWANGFINHNSKYIFSEVEKIYEKSDIFKEACAKDPVKGTDTCYIKLKSAGNVPGSVIEALPVGNDGSKIRGSRFYLLLVDELAQVSESILDLVLRPMSSASSAPMERVRRREEKERLISLGLATESDFGEETVNKLIMTSSGFYKFNHMWRRMRDYWSQMDKAAARGEECQYSVWQVPYWDLPDSFLDQTNIDESRRVMSAAEFSMEYEAAMISDSEGFFKASLLEACTAASPFEPILVGRENKNYVVGVDPNQGGKASCGVVVLEVGNPIRIACVLELVSKTTQELTKSIQQLCDKFNVIRIFMDKGGGGKAICDLLEEGYNNYEPIIDRTEPDHINMQGRHILEMVTFNTTWIAEANFTTKAMLESLSLVFPSVNPESIDSVYIASKAVETLKSQMLSIVVTQTATGSLHFDTPSKHMNKDLYSALILAANGCKVIEKESEDDGPSIFSLGGLIRPKENGVVTQVNFNFIGTDENTLLNFSNALNLQDALLKPLPKKK